MEIHRLTFRHFRNMEKIDLVPDRGFNVLWGNNAQGKTNLLEGIHLLGSLKSFRGARNDELIRRGEAFARLAGEIESQGVNRQIELTIETGGKGARVDGKEVRRSVDFFGHLRPVLFAPEEINLVKGAPSGRRNLLDRALFQTDLTFLERAREYERYLKQRNRLLREERGLQELAPWTEGLIRAGARLRLDRILYIRRLRPLLRHAYQQIAGGEEADLTYPCVEDDESSQVKILEKELARVGERERRFGQTLAGPHRDEVDFEVNGRSLRQFGSQGQQRTFLLAFKTAQIRDLEAVTGEPPVLLLDDMTSELDRRRQDYFFAYLRTRRGQVFITTTDIRPLLEQGLSQGRFFRVEEGALHHDRGE